MTQLIKKEIHTPLASRILVKVDSVDENKKSTLVMLPTTKDRESATVDTGIVIAIGKNAFEGYGDGNPWFEVGDKICFLKHAGAIRKIDGEDYRVLNDVDCLTIITYQEVEVEAQDAAAA